MRSRRTVSYAVVGTLCTLIFLSALVLAPNGCDWGMPVYVMIGLLSLPVLLGVPFFSRRAFHRTSRIPMAMGFAFAGLMVWLMGWFVVFWRGSC